MLKPKLTTVSLFKVFSFLFFNIGLILNFSCNTTEPPPPPDDKKPTLALALEDTSCTEAWLQLTTKDLELPVQLTLKQYNPTGDSVTQTFSLSTQDSLLYIDSLLPNQNYSFQVSSIKNPVSHIVASSNKQQVTTMDTTSHNFTWQTFTFGQHQHSVLYDVAIIDYNNIWAVGEIYMNDSLGNPDPNLYNLIKWDGINWKPERVYYNYQGSNFIAPLHSIFTFAINDVWVGSNQPMHWNGNVWQKWDLLENIWNGWINNIWGSSSNNLFVVGNDGNIAHYNGTSWTKIEIGTAVDLFDIWGTPGGNTIWSCGYTGDYSNTVLLRIKAMNSEVLYQGSPDNQNNNLYIGPLSGGWSDSEYFTYLLNWGALYKQSNKIELDLSSLTSPPLFYSIGFSITANGKNDIFITGQSGFFGHYNGVRFYDLEDLRKNNMQYLGSDVKGDIVVLAGWDYSNAPIKAVIAIGRR